MMPTRRIRTAVGTTLAATALSFVAGAVFAAPIAMANPVCVGGDVHGDYIEDHDPVLVCQPTPLIAVCTYPEAGLEPHVVASVVLCV